MKFLRILVISSCLSTKPSPLYIDKERLTSTIILRMNNNYDLFYYLFDQRKVTERMGKAAGI